MASAVRWQAGRRATGGVDAQGATSGHDVSRLRAESPSTGLPARAASWPRPNASGAQHRFVAFTAALAALSRRLRARRRGRRADAPRIPSRRRRLAAQASSRGGPRTAGWCSAPDPRLFLARPDEVRDGLAERSRDSFLFCSAVPSGPVACAATLPTYRSRHHVAIRRSCLRADGVGTSSRPRRCCSRRECRCSLRELRPVCWSPRPAGRAGVVGLQCADRRPRGRSRGDHSRSWPSL